MAQQTNPTRPIQHEEIDLREELEKYLRYWPWFIIGIFTCIIIAFLYLKFTVPVYNTTASIIIKDDEGKTASSEMAAFADLGLLNGMGTSSIENEIGILSSRRLMKEVVKELNININYYDDSNIQNRELYLNTPYFIQILKMDESLLKKRNRSVLFRIKKNKGRSIEVKDIGLEKSYKTLLGQPLDIGFADIVIIENPDYEPSKGESFNSILVKFNTVDEVSNYYRKQLAVNLTDKNSSLLELNLQDPVTSKAQDVIDQLIFEYNQQAIEDKNLVARNTARFIDERLKIINKELDSVETDKEEFKEANQLTNIEAESEVIIENASEYNKKQQEVGTQLELANAMIDYLDSGNSTDLLPANLGIEETGVNQQIDEYNQLVLERNRILSGSTNKNPVVVRLNSQIAQIKKNVLHSLERMKANLKISKEELERQSAAIGSRITSVPSTERKYRGIERQQGIKESLYLFLLQKREENSLSLAVTAPKAKIVDHAYSSSKPISPKSQIVLLAAFVVGILIPFLIIYIRNLFNNKIKRREDIENITKGIPVVGEVPRISGKQKEMVEKNDRSVLGESFRILHTNLQYLLVNVSQNERGNRIFITSTVKGEGKTFVAFNLALTLANTGKKVLLVGADLRNPQLQRYEKGAREYLGVSDYLVNDSLELKNLIHSSKLQKNLNLLASGSIPPNPSELWRSDKTSLLFKELSSAYDYVIVDTAPSMLVTDTFLINRFADLTLYVTRADYTEKKLLQFAVDSKNDGKLHDVSFVLNDVKLANFGYGNKYGYTYGEDKPGFLQRLKGNF